MNSLQKNIIPILIQLCFLGLIFIHSLQHHEYFLIVLSTLFFIWVCLKHKNEYAALDDTCITLRQGVCFPVLEKLSLHLVESVYTKTTFWGKILGYSTVCFKFASEDEIEFSFIKNAGSFITVFNERFNKV